MPIIPTDLANIDDHNCNENYGLPIIPTDLTDSQDYSSDENHNLALNVPVDKMFPSASYNGDNDHNKDHDLLVIPYYDRNDNYNVPVISSGITFDIDRKDHCRNDDHTSPLKP